MTLSTSTKAFHRHDARLAVLWRHRHSLNEDEWSELYRITVEILRSAHFKELAAFGEEREDLIQSFFVQAVMHRAMNGSTASCDHAGALYTFFRNYVIDELRSRNVKQKYVLSGDLIKGAGSESDPDAFIETCASADNSLETPSNALPEDILAETGISPEAILTSAKLFLRSQDTWVHIYLAYHFCPDEGDSLPLYELARRYQIPSYHSRAARLGITRKKNDLPSDYSKTVLGGWLYSLTGGPFEEVHFALYAAALKMLCLVVAIEEEGLA
jgi:hypothetical protein